MTRYFGNELYHYGVKGMKWGVRRYRNKDGSLTPAGKKRYYGDVTVETNGDNYFAYTKDKAIGISKKSFEKLEDDVNNEIARGYARQYYNMPLKKFINTTMDSSDVAMVDYLIDSCMELHLTDLLNEQGIRYKINFKTKESSNKKPKYTQEQAINKVYDDLEKKYPDFNSFSQEKQDQLWMDYANESGLYKYI